MRLKRLQMQGFKSFADKTRVEFNDQICGVVGPNGCGKSNIVDSIRWVMGEQSAKGLRGKEMSDVIFAGTPARKAAGFAEVSLVFDNEKGQAPAPYTECSELMITRRLYRSGESEYEINNVKARLKDITDLFLGTGSSAKAYSIVAQGKVDEIVLAKPEDRRGLIEEAAGVAKYKVRKVAAERKMASTKDNLSRVQDILKELERNARHLERQVEKAEKFRALQKELREIDEQVIAAKVVSIDGRAEENSKSLEEKSTAHQKVRSELQSIEASLEELRLQSLNSEKITNSQVEELMQLRSDLANRQKDFELNLQKIQLLENQIQEREKDLQRLDTKSKDKEALRTELETQKKELQRAFDEEDHRLQGFQQELKASAARLEELDHVLSEQQAQLSSKKEEQAKNQQRVEMLKASRVDLELSRASLERELEELELQQNEGQLLSQQLQRQHAQMVAEEKAIKNSMLSFDSLDQQIDQELRANEKQRYALKEKQVLLEQEKENLQKLEELQVGYRPGALEAERRKSQKLLMHQLSFKPEFRLMGEALVDQIGQFLVSDEAWTAEVEEPRFQFFKVEASLGASFGQSALDLIESPDHLQPHVRALLTQIESVENIDHSKKWPQIDRSGRFFFAFAEGVEFWSLGKIDVREAPFSRQQELQDIDLALSENRQQSQILLNEYEGLESRQLKLSLQKEKLVEEQESLAEKVKKRAEQLALVREQVAGQTAKCESLRKELSVIDQKIQQKLDELKAVVATDDLGTMEAAIDQTKQALIAARKAHEEKEAQWVEFRIAAGAVKERLERADQQLVELDMTQSEYRHNQGVFKTDIEQWKSEIADRSSKNESLKSELAERGERDKALELSLADAKEKLAVFHHQIEEKDLQRRQLQKNYEELSDQVKELEMQRQDLKFQVEELSQLLHERYQIGLEEALAAYQEKASEILKDEQELKNLEEKAAYLRDRLVKFGDVNLVALQEYEEIKQRLDFMNNQREDLLKTLDSLQSIIDRINKITEFRFRETFKAINHNFELLFPKLFGGGRAHMRLTDEGDLLNTGVEIFAEPPGKKIQNMSLLSGGEKAMTSISLIFSLFAYRPSSFCILDEVDAPLDEANTRRYNEIIQEMSVLSQFIVITHNKKTMEVAETLFGVTMQEPGCSRLVGVNLQQATAFTATEENIAKETPSDKQSA